MFHLKRSIQNNMKSPPTPKCMSTCTHHFIFSCKETEKKIKCTDKNTSFLGSDWRSLARTLGRSIGQSIFINNIGCAVFRVPGILRKCSCIFIAHDAVAVVKLWVKSHCGRHRVSKGSLHFVCCNFEMPPN